MSLDRAKDLGCNTVQIFSHNPRTWLIKGIPDDSALRFIYLRRAYDITPVFIHASYLINLSSPNNEVREKSIQLLVHEMDTADRLNADYVILHTGSASGDTDHSGRKKAVEALKRVLKDKVWRSKLLLENTAGQRGDISPCIGDLAEVIDETGSPSIGGICIDTCHAFAAGYDISRTKGLSEFIREIETFTGLDRVKLIHLNDSKRSLGSRVDRHEHIGRGYIGKEGLKRFINHPAFMGVPLILETPKRDGEDDVRNLKFVRGML